MGKERPPRKRNIKESEIGVQSVWTVGPRTRAWSELWDRIFQEVSDYQENRITDTVSEHGNDC